ncbi:MAG: hypothetical protein NC102_02370 [Clostridium sp.]|nr:hypothetical protein [Clostridium sp.]
MKIARRIIGFAMLAAALLVSAADEAFATEAGAKVEGFAEAGAKGVAEAGFVAEDEMKAGLLQMLADFMPYATGLYTDAGENSAGEKQGYFRANSAGQSNEDGVRTNADMAMVCAMLCEYGPGKVELPEGLDYAEIKEMAKKALTYGYSTHKANGLAKCTDGRNWGSVSEADHVWESSLWTLSLAMASHFLRSDLTKEQKKAIYNMVKAECDYELERSIPAGYAGGDTKAEENGWEANILACALGLYPNDKLAKKWFDRLRAFAINSYSIATDAEDNSVIDPGRDKATVAELYEGACLFPDYTLQNHGYFHTSYQNVVMQELGESALALKLMQGKKPKWQTNALMHNNQEVMDNVLAQLALADGELAMPNGNDWSMFLFDQITSYTTAACFLRDPNALMLENLAYKAIKSRQKTTPDGSWLLHSDIGPRRMGVQAHRVMMTYLMHELMPTADLQPTDWEEFRQSMAEAKEFECQDIVRASTKERFSIFSWSKGLKSYTGYFVPNDPELAKIVVPYKAHNTGNIIGWTALDSLPVNAIGEGECRFELRGDAYTASGTLLCDNKTLRHDFAIYSTPGNAVMYLYRVTALREATLKNEFGGLLAISVDPWLKESREIYSEGGKFESDGAEPKTFESGWVNVDNAIGVTVAGEKPMMRFGDKSISNSIGIARLVPVYTDEQRPLAEGEIAAQRGIAYYSGVDAATTSRLAGKTADISGQLPEGWAGMIAEDPDGTRYALITNFRDEPIFFVMP